MQYFRVSKQWYGFYIRDKIVLQNGPNIRSFASEDVLSSVQTSEDVFSSVYGFYIRDKIVLQNGPNKIIRSFASEDIKQNEII